MLKNETPGKVIYKNIMYMSRNVQKRTLVHVRPAKIQISLRIRAVWSESSLGVFWIAKDANFLHADHEDSDQTARMRRLIWVFFVRTCQDVRFLTFRLICAWSLARKRIGKNLTLRYEYTAADLWIFL